MSIIPLSNPARMLFGLLSVALVLGACGDDGGGSGPTKVDGPFLMTFGAQNKVFSLKTGDATVSCRPKPGLNEFEMTASSLGSDGTGAFKFILKGYAADKADYDIAYEIGQPLHVVDLTIAGGYQYKFFQSFRTDTNQAFNSHCNVQLEGEELTSSTRYTCSMYCVMLWADTTSKDYSVALLNNYIDLVAKFECEY